MEEADETEYCLELNLDAKLTNEQRELEKLTKETIEITKIMSKAKNSTYGSNK